MRSQTSRWGRVRAFAVGLVVSAAAPVIACAQNDDPREAPEVRKLRFVGVDHVSRHDLSRSIATEDSQCKNLVFTVFCLLSRSPTWVEKRYLDREELARDILRIRGYYWRRGYRDATVDTSVVVTGERKVEVTFTIHENRPTLVRRLAVDFDSTLIPEKRITKGAVLRAGTPFDLTRLDSTRVNYINELWSLGYSDGVVDTVLSVDDSVGYVADVRLRLVPNHATVVGPIVVLGQHKVDRQTVLNSLSLRTGDPFRRGDQMESQRNLYESNLFRMATVTVPRDSVAPALRDSIKTIVVVVNEMALRERRIGLGINSVDFVQAQAHYTSYNLFGGARRLDLDATVGNLLAPQLAGRGFFHDPASIAVEGTTSPYAAPTWSVSGEFRQPAFMRRPKDQLGFSGFAHRRATPGIFIDRGYGGSATFTHHAAIRAPASITYRFEVTRVTAGDVYFCVNYGVCDTPTIESLRSHRSLSPLSLIGFIDRSDSPLNPTRGYTARANLEHASSVTMSQYRYNRAFLDIGAYTHRALHVYAAHLKLGFVRPLSNAENIRGVLHPRKRFYAGGASSVRGYGENQLGPRILTIDPAKLGHCEMTRAGMEQCDPNFGPENRDFLPQALGGTSVVEASVEWRFPTPIHRKLDAAVFIDAGLMGESALRTLQDVQAITRGSAAITPGVGLRYRSAVGPIRFDIGFNPKLSEDLSVVTEIIENGERKIVSLGAPRRWSPTGKTLLDRLTLHFSIGQPY